MRAAISAGYAKGFRTIIDANVVTAITALILFAVATADVKGFALMLLIGTVVSLFTAVAATRAMLGLLAGFQLGAVDPRFMGATAAGDPALAADRRRHAAPPLLHHLARRRRPERARDRLPGAEPRHRLQGRRPDHLHDAEADLARERAPAGRRRSAAATPSSRAAATRPAPTPTRASRSG